MLEGVVTTEADNLTPVEAVKSPVDGSVLNDFAATSPKAGAFETVGLGRYLFA